MTNKDVKKLVTDILADSDRKRAEAAAQAEAQDAELEALRYQNGKLHEIMQTRFHTAQRVLTAGRRIKVIYQGKEVSCSVVKVQGQYYDALVKVEIDKIGFRTVSLDNVVLYGWEE